MMLWLTCTLQISTTVDRSSYRASDLVVERRDCIRGFGYVLFKLAHFDLVILYIAALGLQNCSDDYLAIIKSD